MLKAKINLTKSFSCIKYNWQKASFYNETQNNFIQMNSEKHYSIEKYQRSILGRFEIEIFCNITNDFVENNQILKQIPKYPELKNYFIFLLSY